MNKFRRTFLLPILVISYPCVLLISGLLPNPGAIYPIGFVLGIITFYLVYTVPVKATVVLDICVFLVPIVGGLAGSILLWISCKVIPKPVCDPIQFNAQVFGNFAFPLLVTIILWLTQRVPVFFRKK